MFTSRAEHRLLLARGQRRRPPDPPGPRHRPGGRPDSGRLFHGEKSPRTGRRGPGCLAERRVRPDDCDDAGTSWPAIGGRPSDRARPCRLADILRQPGSGPCRDLTALVAPIWPGLPRRWLDEAQTRVKYDGYLRRQEELAGRHGPLGGHPPELPQDLGLWCRSPGCPREVVEKLTAASAPLTLGQASRISGVTPAALACLEIHLKKLAAVASPRRHRHDPGNAPNPGILHGLVQAGILPFPATLPRAYSTRASRPRPSYDFDSEHLSGFGGAQGLQRIHSSWSWEFFAVVGLCIVAATYLFSRKIQVGCSPKPRLP